ncbi:MAG TPA: D-alanyl-D-alanine carboxypeptidase/D-alanyl-D-alanine-endopeptidase, partial [Terriglobia bacterium]
VALNQDKLFIPASTAKLFPAATALTRLGMDFRYRTTVETAGNIGEGGSLAGDLVLVGRGDPNLSGRVLPYNGRTEREETGTRIFQELAAEVLSKGVRAVEGNLVVDDSYFVSQPHAPGWEVDDLQWGYGAAVSALAINDNVIVVDVLPGPRVGEIAVVRIQPMEGYYELDNRVLTIPRAGSTPGGGASASEPMLGMERRPGSTLLRMWGQVTERSAGWRRALAIEDPPRFAGEFFRQELARQGVEVKGNVVVRRLESSDVADLKGALRPPAVARGEVLATHESAPLAESLQVILKVSQNLHAEMLLRTLGRERRNVGSAEAGVEEVNAFLKEMGVRERDVVLRDGSGLTRQNLATPAAMVALLRHMQRSELGAAWTAMLPIAGEDGSLAGRMRNTTLRRRAWVKTGNLSEVAALAGYVSNQQDELLAFAVFVNHHNMTNGTAALLLDRIVELIARSR